MVTVVIFRVIKLKIKLVDLISLNLTIVTREKNFNKGYNNCHNVFNSSRVPNRKKKTITIIHDS